MPTLIELRQKHAEAARAARSLFDSAKDRDMTEAEDAQFTELAARAEDCKKQVEKLEGREAILKSHESRLEQSAGRVTAPDLPHNNAHNNRDHSGNLYQYRFMEAVRSIAAEGVVKGLEGEISQELTKLNGRGPRGGAQGLWFPNDLPMRNHRKLAHASESRDLQVGAGGTAAGFKMITVEQTWIEFLRAQTLSDKIGVRFLTGLTGDIFLPRQNATAQTYWVSESSSAPQESDQAIGQIGFTPKSITAYTNISRKLMLQTSVDVEEFVKEDLGIQVALGIDKAMLNGTGAGSEPLGLLNNTLCLTQSMGEAIPTFPLMIAMETQLAQANALLGDPRYVTSPSLKGALKTQPKLASGQVYPSFIWEADNTVNGYPAHSTTLMPSDIADPDEVTNGGVFNGLIFGNFADMIIGTWSGLDVLVDPYSGSKSMTVLIVVYQDADIHPRHEKSFCVATDAKSS